MRSQTPACSFRGLAIGELMNIDPDRDPGPILRALSDEGSSVGEPSPEDVIRAQLHRLHALDTVPILMRGLCSDEHRRGQGQPTFSVSLPTGAPSPRSPLPQRTTQTAVCATRLERRSRRSGQARPGVEDGVGVRRSHRPARADGLTNSGDVRLARVDVTKSRPLAQPNGLTIAASS